MKNFPLECTIDPLFERVDLTACLSVFVQVRNTTSSLCKAIVSHSIRLNISYIPLVVGTNRNKYAIGILMRNAMTKRNWVIVNPVLAAAPTSHDVGGNRW